MSRKYWYKFNGTTGTGDETTPGQYTLATNPNHVPPGCNAGNLICAIYAPNGGPYPSFISSKIQNYIIDAKMSGAPEPHNAGQKSYVYVRR